ncbi:MAG: hypothetical protein AB8B58_11480 [Roseobacter sp.]
MTKGNIEQKALALLKAFENAGKPIASVTVEGRKIQLQLSAPKVDDEFEQIDMRHGKA